MFIRLAELLRVEQEVRVVEAVDHLEFRHHLVLDFLHHRLEKFRTFKLKWVVGIKTKYRCNLQAIYCLSKALQL